MGQATRRRGTVPQAGTQAGVQTIALSERTTQRLLERWVAYQGGKAVAEAAVAAATGLHQRYAESIGEVVDLPEGASVNVDFKARLLTITPAGSPSRPTPNGHAPVEALGS